MANKAIREKQHPEYYAITAYQILARKSDAEVSRALGMSERTYKDKKKGYSDFTQTEGIALAKLLGRSQEEIFLT